MTTQIGIQDKGSGPVLSQDGSDIEVYHPSPDVGAITRPLQPMFSVDLLVSQLNITGAGTVAPILFDNVNFEFPTGSYSAVTGRWTVPVAGRYFFFSAIRMTGIVAATDMSMRIQVNGVDTLIPWNTGALNTTSGAGNLTVNGSALLSLSALDAVGIAIISNGEAGDILDAVGSPDLTFYHGFLVG